MKCPQCENQHPAKLGQTCSRCGYQFVFDPKSSSTPKMTDGKFLSYIKRASHGGTRYFTANQLYAAHCRKYGGSTWVGVLFGLALVGIGLWIGYMSFNCFAIGLFGFGMLMVFGSLFPDKPLTPTKFEAYTQRFNSQGKPIEKLINEPQLSEPPPDWSEPDIYDYGVERLLIVERDILVDLFVKNEVHSEQRMLVISESGYPRYLVPIAQKLLDERSDLPVFLLHDATFKGIGMKDRVASSGLFPIEDHPVVDLGMYPEDFQKINKTKTFDPKNEGRQLPVDALAMPMLIGGLAGAFAVGLPLSELLEEDSEENSGGGGFDFG